MKLSRMRPKAAEAAEVAEEDGAGVVEAAAERPPGRRMLFRIGVHLGDVVVEEGRLYGDGVNIAARLEALAEPGAVCLSGTVWEQVRGKVEAAAVDLGPHLPLKYLKA